MRISFNSFRARIAGFLLLLAMATPTQAADFSDRGVYLGVTGISVAVLNTTTLDPTETQLNQTLGNLYYFSFGAGLSYRF